MIFRRTRSRKAGSRFARGSALVEVTMALAVLTILGLLLLKSSINALYPRQWTLEQTLSDAYLTYEKAFAQRIPFSSLTAANSPWPVQPNSSTLTNVEIGKIPGGTPIYDSDADSRYEQFGGGWWHRNHRHESVRHGGLEGAKHFDLPNR
jgi:hypothetical protein